MNTKNATGTISPILFVEILENCLGLVERCTRDYLFKTIVPHRAKLFAFPQRSCDLLVIENVFNLGKRELRLQALRGKLAYEIGLSFLSV